MVKGGGKLRSSSTTTTNNVGNVSSSRIRSRTDYYSSSSGKEDYHMNSSLSLLTLLTDDPFDVTDRETVKLQKFGKLLAGPNTDLGN